MENFTMEETKKTYAIINNLELYEELPYTYILKHEIVKKMQLD
mgnify:CR=1 FL=1